MGRMAWLLYIFFFFYSFLISLHYLDALYDP